MTLKELLMNIIKLNIQADVLIFQEKFLKNVKGRFCSVG